jgi:hypothetical protein
MKDLTLGFANLKLKTASAKTRIDYQGQGVQYSKIVHQHNVFTII